VRQFAALLPLVGLARVAAAEPSALWDDVTHPNRLRCAALVDEARRQTGSAAERLLTDAVRLCPGSVEALQALGEARVAADRIAEARQLLERARSRADRDGERGDARLAFYLGFVRAVAGDLEGSLAEYRRAIGLGGLAAADRWLLFYDLGDDYMALGRLGEAVDAYRRAARALPSEVMPHFALAVALDRDGQLDKAREELTIALGLDPQMAQVRSRRFVFVPRTEQRFYLAVGEQARGHLGAARAHLRAFLVALGGGPYAARARERLAAAESVDARELDAAPGVDRQRLALLLAPLVAALEACLPPGPLATVRFVHAGGRLHVEGTPAASCLEEAAATVHWPPAPPEWWATVPLAPR
jgi:tetratricopeptide (TPR) repeat protein